MLKRAQCTKNMIEEQNDVLLKKKEMVKILKCVLVPIPIPYPPFCSDMALVADTTNQPLSLVVNM